MDRDLKGKIMVSLLLLLTVTAVSLFSQELTDTSAIAKSTSDAYAIARRNPDIAIIMSHQSMSASRKLDYKKGIADASLALGMAYLAKYNPGDSAFFYNAQALSLYEETEDRAGMGRACYGLSYVYSFRGDVPSSEQYANRALRCFEEAGDNRGIINTLNVLSYHARQRQDLEAAKGFLERAVATAREVRDTLPLADATNSLGNLYKEMALFSQAIDSYFEALELWEAKSDTAGMSIAYGSIGLAYFYQKDYDRALEFCRKHLLLSEKRSDLWEVSKICNTIAQVHNARGVSDSALVYLRKSLLLNRQMNYPTGEASSCYNIASTLLYMSQPDSAYWYMKQAMDLVTGTGTPVPPEYYVTLANIEQSLGKYSQAMANGTRAYSLGKEKGLPLTVSDASLLLSDLYFRTGRKDKAYEYLREHMLLRDSISNDEFLKQVTRMELQYNYDKKQEAAEYEMMQERLISENKIRQQRTLLTSLGVMFALAALFAMLYLRHTRLKSKYTQIDLEQRLLRAQMNPHFIFNSLCAIQDLIMTDKPQKANAFLTRIARLMRNILENSREEYVSLENEVETLKLYLEVQQLRFENGFEYKIEIDRQIDPENISIPPMLAQPCVENSIEHGILPGRENGRINVSYSLRNGLIMLEITDNGIGRQKAAEISTSVKKQSISTKLTEKRLEHFRKILKEKQISYEITDLYEGGTATGTKVVMMLPYRKAFA
ncbi:MAG TPA: tetratricopeptide repeat protein [Bacteroidales bacterium]|nr:tetratricopeptide repeat protein [Bacteroidales bacterium]HRW27042.1 tetratricopeptide repeat protein [Bacteroidales bacterium]